jgi:hypothetical protein
MIADSGGRHLQPCPVLTSQPFSPPACPYGFPAHPPLHPRPSAPPFALVKSTVPSPGIVFSRIRTSTSACPSQTHAPFAPPRTFPLTAAPNTPPACASFIRFTPAQQTRPLSCAPSPSVASLVVPGLGWTTFFLPHYVPDKWTHRPYPVVQPPRPMAVRAAAPPNLTRTLSTPCIDMAPVPSILRVFWVPRTRRHATLLCPFHSTTAWGCLV